MTSYGHVGWHPPPPSLVSLPVDQTKTEPKPAFYKLQFGDDVTGFNYYVRTTTVVIGRNCVGALSTRQELGLTTEDMKGAPLPPPDERHLGGPTKPPLELGDMVWEDTKPEFPFGMDVPHLDDNLDLVGELALPNGDAGQGPEAGAQEKVVDGTPEITMPIADGASEEPVITQPTVTDDINVDELLATPLPTLVRTTSEDQVEIKVEQPEPPIATDTHTASSAPPESFAHAPLSPNVQQRPLSAPPVSDADKAMDMSIFDDLDPDALEALVQAATSDSPPHPPPPPPPPPPIRRASDTLEHVDVDLGPLKSVSRNHAKISYFADLGHFCLEILGRNGAWVDDRYFVRGSTVPLNQGSQIQIATRIFSFILPPSPGSSPYGTPYDMSYNLEELPYPYNLPAQDLGYQEFYGEGGPGPSSAAALATRFPDQYNVFSAPDGHGLGFSMTDSQNWLAEWSDNSRNSDGSNESDSDSDDSDDSDENSDDFEEASEEEESSDQVEPALVEMPRPATKIKIKLKRPVPQPESDLSSVSSSEEVDSVPVSTKETTKGKGGKKVSPVKGHAVKQPIKSKKQLASKGVKVKANGDGMDIDETPAEIQDDKPTVINGDKVDTVEEKDKVLENPKPKPKTTNKKESKKKAKAAAAATSVSAPVSAPDVPLTLGAIPPPEPAEPPPALTLAALEAANPPPPPPVVRPPPPPAPPTLAAIPPAPTPQPPPAPPQAQTQAVAGPAIRPPMPVRPIPVQTPSSSNTGTPEPQKPFYLTELIETPGRPGHIVVNVPIPPSGAGPRPPPGPLIGLDGEPFIGPPPIKPTATFAVIIHRALLYLPRGRGTLGEVCNWVAGEWEFYRLNIDSGWQNSIRHNLSLNKAFLKVPRIPEDDPESKGSVWIIDPKEGPLFEEKQRKDAMKAEGKGKNTDVRREKERIRVEERQKKLRDMSQDQGSTSSPHRPLPPTNHPHPHPHPHSHHQQQQQHMQPQQRPVATPVRPTPRPVSTHATTGISKGLPAKGKISVNITTITPALRQKSVIATTDQTGKLLPFTCDGTILTLDQTTFGHLTAEIVEKLSVLGPAQAVEVISAWVISKAKQMAAAAAASGKNGTATGNQARPPARPPHVNGGQAVRPQVHGQARPPPAKISPASGTQPLRPAQPAQANGRPPPPASNTSTAPKPAPPPPATASTGPPKPAAPNTTSSTTPAATNPAPAPKPKVVGPAPPGAGLTKVISMIAEVANAKGDVNIVGPHASALLRYIRVVGVDIDLKVADRIWATGILPVLPPKKQGQGGKAVAHKPNPNPTGPATNGNATRPPPTTAPVGSAPSNAIGNAGLKRKMDSATGPSSSGPATSMPPPATTNGVKPPGVPVSGTAAAPITVDGGSELKKTKLEGGVTEVK